MISRLFRWNGEQVRERDVLSGESQLTVATEMVRAYFGAGALYEIVLHRSDDGSYTQESTGLKVVFIDG
jgi:hypothetical protein